MRPRFFSEAMELESLAGARCRLRNPWTPGQVTVRREGGKMETLEGALVELPTSVGERISIGSER